MGRFRRLEVLETVLRIGLVPLFYHPDAETAREIVRACAEGGAQVVEFTHRGDFAPDVFRHLPQWLAQEDIGVVLGVGSVLDAPTAALYLSLGADFVVSPALAPEVARLCNRRQVAYLPGCGTLGGDSSRLRVGRGDYQTIPRSSAGASLSARRARPLPLGPVDAHRRGSGRRI